MDNAAKFISSYNEIDARLRALYRGKGNLNFTDLVRRCAEWNATVKKYAEDLLAFARLRNAIVHESTGMKVIAEPCDEAVARIVRIAELLSEPPRLSLLKEKRVAGIAADAPLADAVVMTAETGYSNLPVYRGGRMAGILGNRRIVRAIGSAVARGEDVDEFLQTPCGDVLSTEDFAQFYRTLAPSDSVQSALDAFAGNRKLAAVIVTEHGNVGDKILNILTASDIPRLMKLLEE